MNTLTKRRFALMGQICAVPATAWQNAEAAGSNMNTMTFSGLSVDLTKSYVYYLLSDAQGGHSPECIKEGSGFGLTVPVLSRPRAYNGFYDTGGTNRNPSITRSNGNGTISFSTTRTFSADVNYTLYYCEIENPE